MQRFEANLFFLRRSCREFLRDEWKKNEKLNGGI